MHMYAYIMCIYIYIYVDIGKKKDLMSKIPGNIAPVEIWASSITTGSVEPAAGWGMPPRPGRELPPWPPRHVPSIGWKI